MKRIAFAALMLVLAAGAAMSQETAPITEAEWELYSDRFVTEEGRVLDDANDDISHSEGQGYGMLLARIAGARDDFERIWSFTRRELLLRDDGLAAWKWEADQTPHVTDVNNASDGDILIAYALATAGQTWGDERLTASAATLAEAIGRHLVYEHEGRVMLRPGVAGFSGEEREVGPVVNPSYWVFEAFASFEALAPETDWQALAQGGLELVSSARFSDRQLPPDWLSIGSVSAPAQGFEAEFGYNALRIPLYLMRAGMGGAGLIDEMRRGMVDEDANLTLVDLATGTTKTALSDAGYRIIPAMAACVVDDAPIEPELLTFAPTVYYPSTLHLLALAHLRQQHAECLP